MAQTVGVSTLIGEVAEALAFGYFAVVGAVLAVIDVKTRRLPNRLVLPAYLVAGLLFATTVTLTGDGAVLLRAGVGMVVLYAFYFALRLVRSGGMGGGDVKLAGVIGIYLGWVGWSAVAVGAFAAFVYGGLYALALLLLRRAGRRTTIPFGPFMLLGAWTGILLGDAIARGYLGSLLSV